MKKFAILLSFLFMPYVLAEEIAQVQPQVQAQPQAQVQTKTTETQAQAQPTETQTQVINPLIVPQNISYENCTKIFNVAQEKLFYLTLVALSANKFIIDEMQSSNGYIIFSANHNKYLATIAGVNDSNAILKFPPGIITSTFKYIDLNLTTKI